MNWLNTSIFLSISLTEKLHFNLKEASKCTAKSWILQYRSSFLSKLQILKLLFFSHAGAESLPCQMQHAFSLWLDQYPPSVHTGQYKRKHIKIACVCSYSYQSKLKKNPKKLRATVKYLECFTVCKWVVDVHEIKVLRNSFKWENRLLKKIAESSDIQWWCLIPDINAIFSTGGYYSCLFFLCILCGWSPVSGSSSWWRTRHVCSLAHTPAVLLLCWVAEGENVGF